MKENQELLISSIHLPLTEALKAYVTEKTHRLFRHETKIIRIRVELIQSLHKVRDEEFEAQGIIELQGPSIIVGVADKDLYKAIDLLVDKLDRQIHRRMTTIKAKRNDTINQHL